MACSLFVERHLGSVMLQQFLVVRFPWYRGGLSWKSVIAFLDDVVVLGRDFDSHMVNLSDVLRRFEQYGIKLKPKEISTYSGFSGIFRTTSEPGRGASPSWGDYSNW